MASAQKKHVSLQRQAAVTVEAAEDYARRFESGVNELSSNDQDGEELAHFSVNVMCRMCFLGESQGRQGSERARRMLSFSGLVRLLKSIIAVNCRFVLLERTELSLCCVCEVCRRTGDPNKFVFSKKFVFCNRCNDVKQEILKGLLDHVAS